MSTTDVRGRFTSGSLMLAVLLLSAPVLGAQTPRGNKPAQPAKEAQRLDLNTASAVELQELPGIGPSTAARILEYREKHGPFKKVEELMNIRGIGEKSFLRLRPLVTVTPEPQRGATGTEP